MMKQSKEIPNTANIRSWPEGYQEVRRRSNEKAESLDIDTFDWKKYMYSWAEYLEFYLFTLFAAGLWCVCVVSVLNWHNFPYHIYLGEVFLIITIPIVVLTALLVYLDKNLKAKDD